jgi:adenylate cyclase
MPFAFRINSNASQDRLERLIQQRLQPNANTEEVDKHIWDLFGEQWAVMYTDLVGFSRHVSEYGIIHFLQTIYESHRLLVPIFVVLGGLILLFEGVLVIVIFLTVMEAMDRAMAMQL